MQQHEHNPELTPLALQGILRNAYNWQARARALLRIAELAHAQETLADDKTFSGLLVPKKKAG